MWTLSAYLLNSDITVQREYSFFTGKENKQRWLPQRRVEGGGAGTRGAGRFRLPTYANLSQTQSLSEFKKCINLRKCNHSLFLHDQSKPLIFLLIILKNDLALWTEIYWQAPENEEKYVGSQRVQNYKRQLFCQPRGMDIQYKFLFFLQYHISLLGS